MLQLTLHVLKQSMRISECKSEHSYKDGEPNPHNPYECRYFSNSARRSKTNSTASARAKTLQIAFPVLKQSTRIRGCKSDDSYEDGEPDPRRYFPNSERRSKTNDSCEERE